MWDMRGRTEIQEFMKNFHMHIYIYIYFFFNKHTHAYIFKLG